MENEDEFRISFRRLVAVHYCLSYVVKTLKNGIVGKMKDLAGLFIERMKPFIKNESHYIDENYHDGNMKSKALEFINEHSYGNNRGIETIDDALSQILNNLKTNSSRLQLLKIFINQKFVSDYDQAQKDEAQGAAPPEVRTFSITKSTKTFDDLDVQSVLSFAKYSNHAKEILDLNSAKKLLLVRNLLSHYLIRKTMDENTFMYCMQEIKLAVTKNNIVVPFSEHLDKLFDTKLKGRAHEVAYKIYLEAATSVGISKNRDLLKYMVDCGTHRNQSFDARLEMLVLSCQLLKNHEIEGSRLNAEFDVYFHEIWDLRSKLIGNLKECIEMVINKTKDNIRDSFLKTVKKKERTGSFKHHMKVAIMSIKALAEKQLKIDAKLSFEGFKGWCEKEVMSISAHGGKPKKGRKKKNQKAKPNPKQDNKQVEQQVQQQHDLDSEDVGTDDWYDLYDDRSQQLYDILKKFCENKFSSLNKFIVIKLIDLVEDKFPNYARYDELRDEFIEDDEKMGIKKPGDTFYELYITKLIEDKVKQFKKEESKSFDQFLTSIEHLVNFLFLKAFLESKTIQPFKKGKKNNFKFSLEPGLKEDFAKFKWYNKFNNQMKEDNNKIIKEVVKDFYDTIIWVHGLIRSFANVNFLPAEKKSKDLRNLQQCFLLDKNDSKSAKQYEQNIEKSDFHNVLKETCNYYNNYRANIKKKQKQDDVPTYAHFEFNAVFRTECGKFFDLCENKGGQKKLEFIDSCLAILSENMQNRLQKVQVGDNSEYTEEHHTFALYFYSIIQFQHFSLKSYNFGVGQASTFRALCSYSPQFVRTLDINFQYDDDTVFEEYGKGDNSLFKRWNEDKVGARGYYQTIQKFGINNENIKDIKLTNQQKQPLEKFLNFKLFKFEFSETFSEAIKKCVLDPADNIEEVKIECSKITRFRLIKFEKELDTIVKSWLYFIQRNKNNNIHKSNAFTKKRYYNYFKSLCRVVAHHAVLKLVTCESVIEAKETVDFIVQIFPYKNTYNIDKEDLYKEYCVACYHCFTNWRTGPSLISRLLERSSARSFLYPHIDVENSLTEVILFKKELSEFEGNAIFFSWNDYTMKVQGPITQVIDDCRQAYQNTTRYKQLVQKGYRNFIDEVFNQWHTVINKNKQKNILLNYRFFTIDAYIKKHLGSKPQNECLLLKDVKSFEHREAHFVFNLMKERILKRVVTEEFVPISAALENHEYFENDSDSVEADLDEDACLNEVYARQRATDYHRQIINGVRSSVWPATVDVKNEKDGAILSGLFSALDIFKDDTPLGTLVDISLNKLDADEIVERFNEVVTPNFDEAKLKARLLHLSELREVGSEEEDSGVGRLVQNKLKPIGADRHVQEKQKKADDGDKLQRSSSKDESSRAGRKHEDNPVNANTKPANKQDTANRNKRKSTGEGSGLQEKISRPSDAKADGDISKEISKVERMDLEEADKGDSDEGVLSHLDDCLNKELTDKRMRNNQKNVELVKGYFDKAQQLKGAVEAVEEQVEDMKKNLERMRTHKQYLKDAANAGINDEMLKELYNEILRQLCLFYYNYVDGAKADENRENYIKILSDLFSELVKVLDDFVELPAFAEQL